MEKIKSFFANRGTGFYVGVASIVLALVTFFIYLGMQSMYFSGLVVAGIFVGIACFVVGEIFNIGLLKIASEGCYMFALYHFLVLEIEYRMDTLVDPQQGIGAIDGIFWAAIVFFLLAIIAAIVATAMKSVKEPKVAE